MEASAAAGRGGPEEYRPEGRRLVWAAMIPAVAMTFIDITIVSIAVPEIQKDLSLSATGIQWVITGFLVSSAALIAFGGRVGDIFGHKRMVILGILIFATASLLCGLTPDSSIAETWMIVFRVIQGLGTALIFPAALTLVLSTYPVSERGKAISLFFILAGLFTAIGPIAGGYLSEWTWRSIFWINIPVAILALILTARARPLDLSKPAKIDFAGLFLLVTGMGLTVLGVQQSQQWGWDSPATWASIGVGLLLLLAFVRVELRVSEPLIKVRMYAQRAFLTDSAVVILTFGVFVSVFFFSSMYAQIALGESVGNAGLYLAVFFGGFAIGSRRGGAMMDSIGVRHPTVIGGALATAGFFFWGQNALHLSLNDQWWAILMAGAGIGLVVSPISTNAINQVPAGSRGEAVGVLMTARNFGSAVGLAALGTVLFTVLHDKLQSALHLTSSQADSLKHALTQAGGGDTSALSNVPGHSAAQVFADLQRSFAESTRVVLYVMAGMMAVVFVIAFELVHSDPVEEKPPAQPPEGAAPSARDG